MAIAPACGVCAGASGTITSSKSSWETALMVNESASLSDYRIKQLFKLFLQTPMQKANKPTPVRVFRKRYGLRARMRAADCL
jgi:hypothetical protein